MLSDEAMSVLSDRLVRRYENLNTYIIKQIGETLKQIGKLTPTQAMQLEAMLKYGGSFDKITKEISKITKLSIKDIYEIYEKMAIENQRFASTFYKYREMDMIPYKYNEPLKREVQALAKITADTFINISGTEMLGYGFVDDKTGKITYKGLKQAYYDIIDEGILAVSQGKDTFDNRVSKIMKDIGESGLKVIYPTTYQTRDKKTGRIITKHYARRLDSVISTTMQTGIRDINNELQEMFGNEYGANMIEVKHHGNPAPDHEDTVDGKQFARIEVIKEQITNGTEKQIKMSDIDGNRVKVDGKWYYDYDYINDSLTRPVGTLNCKHRIRTGILGLTKPEYTEEQLEKAHQKNKDGFEYNGKQYSLYEGEQLMRNIELELRKAKDIQIGAKASGNEELLYKSQTRINMLTDKYAKLLKASKLPSQIERAKTIGYHRVSVKNI